jgi:hypothetical protein
MRDLQGIAEINGPRRVELQAERAANIEVATAAVEERARVHAGPGTVRALPRVRNRVNNAPAYHGEYRSVDGKAWIKVLNNSQLPICYTTPEAAIAAALLYHGTAR